MMFLFSKMSREGHLQDSQEPNTIASMVSFSDLFSLVWPITSRSVYYMEHVKFCRICSRRKLLSINWLVTKPSGE